MVYNGDFQTFIAVTHKNTTYVTQIFQDLGYKVCSTAVPKFVPFGLFILVTGKTAIIHHQLVARYEDI